MTSLAALVLTALMLTPPPPGAASPVRDPSAAAAAPAAPGAAIEVLHAWDRRRARAWARGDVTALRRGYVAGSRAGRADVAMLRAYAARGLRVSGLRTQLLAVEVRARTRSRLALLVTDRLAGGVVRGAGRPLALPHDLPTTYTVTMIRRRDDWRVEVVR